MFEFIFKNWQWFGVGGACILGIVQLRLHLHQTKELRLKINELERKEAEALSKADKSAINGVTFQTSFHGFSYQELILESWELTVILNDGRSWVDSNREFLQTRFSDPRKKTRFCFIHPESPYIDILIQKNGKRKSSQIDEIRRSVKIISQNKSTPHDIEIAFHKKPTPYCLFLTEKIAIVHPYLFFEAGGLPMYTFANGTPLYAIYRDDAQKLLKEAEQFDDLALDRHFKKK